jgi:hypothetical protein
VSAASKRSDWLRDALTRAQGEWRCSRVTTWAAFNAQRWILSVQLGPLDRRIRDRAGLAELDVPASSGEPFAEAHKVNYGTEICGVAAGAKSLRKRS